MTIQPLFCPFVRFSTTLATTPSPRSTSSIVPTLPRAEFAWSGNVRGDAPAECKRAACNFKATVRAKAYAGRGVSLCACSRSLQRRGRYRLSVATVHAPFDVAIIGGGIIGCGIARDAALRGLRVALFERADFGSGTTSASTRIVHGGLRYLEMLDFRLVRLDLRERETLLRIAPHLVKPLEFLIPFFRRQPGIGAETAARARALRCAQLRQ